MKTKTVLIGVIALAITGCAGTYRSPAASRASEIRESFQSADSYCASLMGSPELEPLWKKTAARIPDTSFAMLEDQQFASAEERPLINNWGDKLDSCHRAYLDVYTRFSLSPQLRAVRAGFYGLDERLLVALHNGQLTWGNFNQRRKELYEDFMKANADVTAALRQHDEQAAFRAQQLANQTYANILQEQRNTIESQRNVVAPLSSPQITCTTYGNTTTCQ